MRCCKSFLAGIVPTDVREQRSVSQFVSTIIAIKMKGDFLDSPVTPIRGCWKKRKGCDRGRRVTCRLINHAFMQCM